MKDNIRTFTDFEKLADDEMQIIDDVTDELMSMPQIGLYGVQVLL